MNLDTFFFVCLFYFVLLLTRSSVIDDPKQVWSVTRLCMRNVSQGDLWSRGDFPFYPFQRTELENTCRYIKICTSKYMCVQITFWVVYTYALLSIFILLSLLSALSLILNVQDTKRGASSFRGKKRRGNTTPSFQEPKNITLSVRTLEKG